MGKKNMATFCSVIRLAFEAGVCETYTKLVDTSCPVHFETK